MASKTMNQAAADLVNQTKMFNNLPTTPHYDYEFPFEKGIYI